MQHFELVSEADLVAAQSSLLSELQPEVSNLLSRVELYLDKLERREQSLIAKAELQEGRLSRSSVPTKTSNSSVAQREVLTSIEEVKMQQLRQKKERLSYAVSRLELQAGQRERQLRKRTALESGVTRFGNHGDLRSSLFAFSWMVWSGIDLFLDECGVHSFPMGLCMTPLPFSRNKLSLASHPFARLLTFSTSASHISASHRSYLAYSVVLLCRPHMPSRRRPVRLAAAIPASRLPLGTPLLGPDRRSGSDNSLLGHQELSPSLLTTSFRHSFANKENTPHSSKTLKHSTPPYTAGFGDMSTSNLAQAKLERQRKREEDFDAIMNAPPLPPPPANPEKERPPARAKGKWKSLDLWASGGRLTNPSTFEGLPVSEVRINTFRPASRASTQDRPRSSLSQRSNDAVPADRERHGSHVGNFQLFSRNKGRRPIEQLSAYEDEPEQRQQTVEATFDQREIYQVFGSKPPGMEFIEQNVGDKNGQLQFIQHPNGDISAHQWSTERFLWENIGQFSNIRKKVEGQLAADCLKGETAEQTLQRNTLAYFRTIAKQREASAMGLPFGSKEIQAAMPDTRPAQHPAPSVAGVISPALGTKAVPEIDDDKSLPPSVQTKPEAINSPARTHGTNDNTFPQAAPGAYFAYGQQYFVPPKVNNNHQVDIYGTIHTTGRTEHPGMLPQQHYPPFQSTLNTIAGRLDDPFYPTGGQSSYDGTHTLRPPVARSDSITPTVFATQPRGRNSHSDLVDKSSFLPSDGVNISTPKGSSLGMPRSGDVTPLTKRGDRGTAFKDQVDRFTGQAMQRSLSQANTHAQPPRTVLYDPMRDLTHRQTLSISPAQDPHASTQLVREEVPIVNQVHKHPIQQLQQQQQLAEPRQIGTYAIMPNSTRRGPLQRQVPVPIGTDNNPQQPPKTLQDSRTCLVDPHSPWPQNFKGPFFAAEKSPTSLSKRAKTQDEELQDWWINSNTLARREELYQSLMTSSKPIGDCSTEQASVGSGMQASLPEGTMTRILIPVWENLASYIEGPVEKRRDNFSRWCEPPEWCIDRSHNGNNTFFDSEGEQPSTSVGTDASSQSLGVEGVRFGGFTSPQDSRVSSGSAMDSGLTFGSARR
nr:dash complex subunit spc19 [Quercus suber]